MSVPAIDIDVNRPQGQLLSLPKRFRGYVGGFGSGKTYVGCIGLCNAAYLVPGVPQGYFAPTYSQAPVKPTASAQARTPRPARWPWRPARNGSAPASGPWWT